MMKLENLLGKMVWSNRAAVPFKIGEKIGLEKKEYEICKITHILGQEFNNYLVQYQTMIVCKTIA